MTSNADNRTGVRDQGFVDQGLERLDRASRSRDAEGLLAHATDLLRAASVEAGDGELELYVRDSHRIRVERERADDRATATAGRETGLAVRLRTVDGRVGFGARSGLDGAAAFAAALDAANAAEHSEAADHDEIGWADGSGDTERDLDDTPPPTTGELGTWLDEAWVALERWRDERRRRGVEIVDGWIEAAATVELIASSRGLRAVRSRCRGRTRARLSSRRPASEPAALELAARDWRDLDPNGWIDVLHDRVRPAEETVTTVHPAGVFVFSPESASSIVQALVMALSMRDGEPPPIGAGWRVRDEPHGKDGTFGGTFDDAGFETEPVVLADGRRILGPLPSRGHLRRGSYRDRPAPRPWRLIVEPPETTLPPRAQLVSSCRILPFGAGGWCLELETATLEGGVATARHPAALVMSSPASLVARCVGGLGAVRSLANGVRTPALVFDGLQPRARR